MNIAYFLLPKNRIAYLYDDFTFRQGLEKMRNRGRNFSCLPLAFEFTLILCGIHKKL